MFNPFGKDFRELTGTDLEVLRSVAEGWYIEYKRQKPDGKRIAASIASFANSHGGSYFIGIESDPKTNRALHFPGVVDSPDVFRDSVRGHLQPFPFFETFTIALGSGTKVLMAVVPEGDDPPYIHSDGRIYRRQEAASDPVPETNRYTIDMLYRRALEFKEELEKFRQIDLDFSNAEGEVPFLEMFVNTVPFNHFFMEDFFSTENLRKLMDQFNAGFSVEELVSGNKVGFSGSMKFDTISTYHDSISLRYLEGQHLVYNGMTLMIDVSGNLKLLIPLAEHDSSEDLPGRFLERYQAVLNRSQGESVSSLRFLRAKHVAGAIFGVMSNYVKYLDGRHYKEGFETKLRLTNCWRKALYIDSERFVAHVEAFGIPVCMKSNQYFPLRPIAFKIGDLKSKPVMENLAVFSLVANALGVPSAVAVASIIEEIRDNP